MDAATIATHHGIGQSAKNLFGWGTRTAIITDAQVPTGSPLELRVASTPPSQRSGRRRATAHGHFQCGAFRGSFRPTW